MKTVPLLVTLDVHGTDAQGRPRRGVAENVRRSLTELGKLGIRATYFVPALVMEEHREIVEQIRADGHEVASHGFYHNDQVPFRGLPPERYDLLDESTQEKFFEGADRLFEKVLGDERPTSFRSPCFGISGPTVQALERHGFKADFSVSSQRLDFLTSNPYGFKNLLAPRLPYHPDRSNPFKAGDSKLWEIPVSSFVLPLAVMTVITFGMGFSKWFFRALRKESESNGKPIVYMCHAEEFCPDAETYTIPLGDLKLADFLPLKGRGFRARQAFRLSDPAKIYERNVRYIEFMNSADNVESVTANQYIEGWLQDSV